MRAQRPRGIVLISVMFLAVLIAMYVASSAMLTKGQYGAMRATAEDRRAEEAARSGLEYAQARLEENPEWRGDGNGVIIDSGPLMVREERGNVVGILTTSDGGRAQFRIRFNHQDGANGGDAMADPSGPMLIDSRHVSVNNVLNSYQTALPLGDGANYRCQGAVTSYPVPAFSAAVVCEGRVFDGLAAAGSSNLNPPVSNLQASRVVEAFYRVSDFTGEAPAQDAVAMAGGEVDMQLFPNASATQRLSMTNFQGSGPSRFRGRGDISITDMAKNAALVEGSDASLMMLSDKTLTANLGSGVARGSEDSNTDFYKVTWDQAGEPSANAVDVPAGVYVFWAGDQTLHHYNMDFEQYVKHIKKNPTDPGSTPAMPDGMNFVKAGNLGPDGATSTKHRFVITKDVQIRAADGVKDLTIIPRAGAREDLPTTPGGPLPALAAEFNLTEDMTAQEMLTALSAAGLSLSPGGNVHNLLSEVAEGATMTVDGDRSTGMWSNNYGGPFGGPDDDDGADDDGPPPWQPASGTVSWSPSGLNLGGAVAWM